MAAKQSHIEECIRCLDEVIGEAKVYAALKHGKTKMIRVIVSPDLEDAMLLGWRSQKTLGMLPDSWPEVMPSERCYQVTTGEDEKKKENKEEGDFPIDPKYTKVLAGETVLRCLPRSP